METESLEEDFDDGKWPFTGEGEFADVLKPKGVGCAQVSKVLARADEHAGEYSFGGLADTLPAVSGLFVGTVGTIHTPLVADQAEKLIALCKKSPFGHNLDTKMDENVRKSWQLDANLVRFKNPLWQVGMNKLQKVIADRLGYTDVPLECVLYKLLVYGEGGHFVKHQDKEKEDGMIATLVVQPPSAHEGGDLAVYRDGELTYRHDFGKADGSAAFATHYAVHYADAEHALEEVTKGFRLALVYSICLPATMRHLKRTEDKQLSEDLAHAISSMSSETKTSEVEGDAAKPEDAKKGENDDKNLDKKTTTKGYTATRKLPDDGTIKYVVDEDADGSFALLLVHKYTTKSIQNLGSGALEGIDRARFHALEEANALVAPDKKLRFFIARLAHDVRYYDDGGRCRKDAHRESMTWYSMAGEDQGRVKNSKQKLNLLNPGNETLEDLWWKYGILTKEGGYTGNAGSTKITTYSRYAIVAWRVADDAKKALRFLPMLAAAEALRAQRPVDGAALRKLFDTANVRLEAENRDREYWEGRVTTWSMDLREVVCDLLVDAGDIDAVNLFFNDYCGALGGLEGNEAFVPSITKILRAYNWDEVGEAVCKALGESDDKGGKGGLSALEMILRVIDGLDHGAARQALIDKAMQQTTSTKDEDLFVLSYIGVLWKVAIDCADKTLFDAVADRLKNADPSLLGPSIQYLSQYVNSADANDEKAGIVAFVAPKRIQWLRDQVEALEKPFSWEMREAEFPDNDEIQSFLRGLEVSMEIKGAKKRFNDLEEAKQYAADWAKKQTKCSFEAEGHETDGVAFVTITKTRDWFLKQQSNLVLYRKELRRLVDRFDKSSGDVGEKKRSRHD
ncbi:hypothetical protein PHYSODRAFT_261828 [Phytophthora sojae]|uniref:Fe2OG dioxygenase domain-containing protein n=1 Tax=Phytophthora sojae (strain P6497) TaxID=1094619 RepID=G5A0X4_PHYSP|nr:hypothetical protein PHYSODRAFT_261828 [Phytophthora sojae]EGZ10606.1 hypothetical protein PHYSODRAFT_261828 [Phytophthora sojae]|eukprot:XP_009533351.1 hypothetical protein PHYSODRAFT_261828 [Phytophthora sojae]